MPTVPSRCLLLLLLAGACATPEPAPAPALALGIDHLPTTAVAGWGNAAGTVETARLSVAVHDGALPPGSPLDTRAEAILSDRGQPFRAGSALLRGLLLATPDQLAPGAPIITGSGQVGEDFVTRIRITGSELPELLAARAGDGLRLALRTPARAEDPAIPARELALLTPIATDKTGRVTLLQRLGNGDRGLAIVLQFGEAPTPDEFAELQAELESHVTTPAAAPPTVAPTALAREAIGALPRRGALLAAASRYDLSRCLDFLLCIGERDLIAIAEAMPTEPENAWQIEHAFWTAILPPLQRDELPPSARVSLRRQFGTLALDPTAFEFALDASPDATEFEAAVRRDNWRGLEDRRVLQRVTAIDWLASQGTRIPDYDPLASRELRKAALAQNERQQR